MADVRPFRAVRYNPEVVGDLAQVVTPPYDVIDPDYQETLYERHPNNFVRLDLTRDEPGDGGATNKYTRAAQTLRQWRQQGVMARDDRPAFYVYHQTFEHEGQTVLRKGFIGAIRVHDYSERVVLPHERTLRGPKIDRLDLMKATEAQMSQIFLLYNDPELRVDQALEAQCARPADIDITFEDGIRNQLWLVTDEATLRDVQALLADQQLLIADGHHRYETAVGYRDLEPASGEDRPRDFTMAYLANAADPGLLVFPTHRALHSVPGFAFDEWLNRIGSWFTITDISDLDENAALERLATVADHPSYVVLRADGGALRKLLIELRLDVAQPELDKLDVVDAARTLDVTVLHDFLLDRLTGVDLDAQARKVNLRYPRFLPDALAEARRDDVHVVFLMNATPIDRIREVCVTGGFMPQKSTYFYPKVLSGLVVNDLSSF